MSHQVRTLPPDDETPHQASRRMLERDLSGLIATHTLHRLLHAMVETCYKLADAYDPKSRRCLAWREAGRILTFAEDGVARLDLQVRGR